MILNRYERMVAKRYLLPGKGEGFIFLVAGISLVAVALGVAALIIVMSVMNGFRAELFDKIVGLNGHAIVQGYEGRLNNWQQIAEAARKTPGVTAALPLIEQPLMASSNGRVEGVLVRGMRVADIRGNKTISGNVKSGDIRSITPGSGRVALGSRLAEMLGAYPGSQISLISPEGRSTVVGTVPRIVSYTVGAVFEVGVYDYDKAFVIMPMEDAQRLLMMGDQVGSIEEKAGSLFRRLLARRPAGDEMSMLVDFYESQRGRFERKELDASAIAGPGDPDLVERAAWTVLARSLFNLDEAVTKR